jgi:Ni,Fe-hydrogenase maturation factor
METGATGLMVIGVGNKFRRDDGAGLAVVSATWPRRPAWNSWSSTANPPG